MQARAGAVVRPRPPRDQWELVYHERFVLAVREGETMTRALGDAWLGAAAAALLATAPATTALAKKEMSPNTLGGFLAYAKANQSTLTYANAGIGSASYLCGLLFMSTIQADFTTVPYKGTGPAMTDLVGGRVDFMCDQTTNTTPQIKAGTIKVYGVTSKMRVPSLPDVPTLEEEGLKGFALVVWNGLLAPRGTPKAALD